VHIYEANPCCNQLNDFASGLGSGKVAGALRCSCADENGEEHTCLCPEDIGRWPNIVKKQS
jgi:hypothetical protein